MQAQNSEPPRVRLEAIKVGLDATEALAVQNRRLSALCFASTATCLVLAVALAMLQPLKERVPYFVEVESATGRVDVSAREAMRFEPNEANIRYFLNRWVVDTFSIDEATRSHRLPASYSLLRGAAIDQWTRIVLEGDDPIGKLAKNPAYRRSVEVIAPPQIVADGSAIMRIALVEGRNVVGRRQVAVRFALIPPADDRDLMRSPIGLWITDLGVVNESF